MNMNIGGLVKFSLIDYPGKMAAVVFTKGCDFRCPFCHNSELVIPEKFNKSIPREDVIQFLSKKRGKLEGVVISGGEPTLQEGLIAFLDLMKRFGYLVKIDTNGSRPDVLKTLINLRLVNYLAMDIKAPLHKYHELTGVNFPTEKIQESINIILNSNLPHEFRTTLVKPLLKEEDIADILPLIEGARKYTVQRFIPSKKMIDPTLKLQDHYSEGEIEEIKNRWESTTYHYA
jgi:pyruvate formate lyase activating enzyme